MTTKRDPKTLARELASLVRCTRSLVREVVVRANELGFDATREEVLYRICSEEADNVQRAQRAN